MWSFLHYACDTFPSVHNARLRIRHGISTLHFVLFVFLSNFTEIQVLLWMEAQPMCGARLRNQLHW
jgi:hypothetical protein